jgi:LEA14-like dessication related protein
MKVHHLLPMLAILGGCEELDPYLPKVRFKELQVQDIDFQKADVDFVFSVDNPDPVDISLSSFSYNLGLEDVNFLSGDDADGMTLAAVGSSDLALPVSLTWEDAWNTVQATKGEDYVDFGLDGDFGFETPIGEALIPYDAGGNFPAVRTPKFGFKKLRVTHFDPFSLSADVAVDLNVENEHASSLFFENFDYDLSLGDNHVGHGLIPDLGAVDGATTGVLTLPLTIDLFSAGDQVIQAISGNGNLNIGLDATTDVDTPFGLLPLSIDEKGNIDVQSP